MMGQQLIAFVRENALLLIVLLGMAGAFVFLRTRGTPIESVDEFDALLTTGQPVVVEIYSNT
jgi:formamidopyrimidine-DNA glycosylase